MLAVAVCFLLCALFSFPETSGKKLEFTDPDETLRHYKQEVGRAVRLKCDILYWQSTWKMKWYQNGQLVQLNKRKNKRFRVRAGRSSLLKIRNVRREDAGIYKCVARNKYGSISRTMYLTVTDKPKSPAAHGKGPPWFVKPFDTKQQFVAWPASKDLKLRCAADGEQPLKYTWLKDGKVLEYRRLDPKFNNSRWFLKIRTAVPSDNGLYTCVVSNRLGNISQTFKLRVIEKGNIRPVLSTQFPVNKTAKVGENVTFQCVELFSPWITDYQWLHWKKFPPSYPDLELLKDVEATSLNSSYYKLIDPIHYEPFKYIEKGKYGGRVLLTNVTKEDEGMYTCLISNHFGKVYRSAFLKVNAEVNIGSMLSTQFPVNKTAKVGENVTFQCVELFSSGNTDHHWLHWKKSPPTYPDLELKVEDATSSNSSYYTIIDPILYTRFQYDNKWKHGVRVLLTNVTKEDEGMYACLISNHTGKDYRSAFLKVHTSSIQKGASTSGGALSTIHCIIIIAVSFCIFFTVCGYNEFQRV